MTTRIEKRDLPTKTCPVCGRPIFLAAQVGNHLG